MNSPGTIDAPVWWGHISPTERSRGAGSLAIYLVVLTLALGGPLHEQIGHWAIVPYGLALATGLIARQPQAVHVGGAALLMAVLAWAIGQYWPLTSVVFLLVYWGVVTRVPWLRESCLWWKKGSYERSDVWLAVAFITVSAVSLVVWSQLTTADLSEFQDFIPDVPIWALFGGLFFYACLNALFEEVVWRGVVMQALESSTGSLTAALILQSVAFGLWHFVGFPSGWIGVGLAAIFAFMMGLLRVRTRGLLIPFVAHVAADVTIYLIVALLFF